MPALRSSASSALPPGPSWPTPVQTLAWVTRPKPFLTRARAKYGDVFTICFRPNEPFVVIADPEAVREIFTGDPEVLRAGEGNRVLLPLLGKHSLLLLDGKAHLRERKLLLPPFHGERMQKYRSIIEDATERQVATWKPGEPLVLAKEMQAITLDVIARAVFGVTEATAAEDLKRVLMQMLGWVMDHPSRLLMIAMLRPEILDRIRPFQRMVDAVDQTLFAEIRARRDAPDLAQREDILSQLLTARDEAGDPMTDQELRDQLLTLLVAGHETTATGLAWAFERLMRHPGTMREAVRDARDGDGSYLDAVGKEILRMRPVLPAVARRLGAPMTIGGREYPAGTDVAPSIYLIHHREDVYPQPYEFRPERFLGKKPGTYTWLPFGGGVRRCIGASFALFEMQVVMQTILRSVDLRPVDDQSERTARRTITLVPEHGARAVPSRAA